MPRRAGALRGVLIPLGASLAVGVALVAIGAFFVGVVFAAQPGNGYTVVSATCLELVDNSSTATLTIVLEKIPASWDPFLLSADLKESNGMHQISKTDLDRETSEGAVVAFLLRKDGHVDVATAKSVRLGWSSGEPGFYQDIPLGIVWDENGCAVTGS